MFKLGVLASGNGSNLQAIIDACANGKIPAQVAIVVSDMPAAYALQRAAQHQIPTIILAPTTAEKKDSYATRLVAALAPFNLDLICMAGFMRLVGSDFLATYPRRVINIHPSLLPAYRGLQAIERAYSDRATETGCTVHYVDDGMDTGPIIAQYVVSISTDEPLAQLTEKIHAAEHSLYPHAINLILSKLHGSD